jgi:branched-chain amino acid transport system permease protein
MQIVRKHAIALLTMAALCVLPPVAQALDQLFYVSFASRVLIYGLFASSLSLLIGTGGMLSFGHAAYFGAGAYTVAILAHEASVVAQPLLSGSQSAWVVWPLAAAVASVLAFVIGAISLRTRGAYFIMITLAFAQMLYYVFVSLRRYGGDDGMSLPDRSKISGLDLQNDVEFYYVVLAIFVVVLYLLGRLIRSRFGAVVAGIRQNEVRMSSIGYPVYRYKLACFVIAGGIAGLAGALSVNQAGFAGPGLMHWMQSGSVMVMVILGGVGSPYGGVLGAAAFLLLEEVLSDHTPHWPLALGLLLLAVVFFAPRGLAGLFDREHAR